MGDDYGRPADVPWAVAFPQGAPPTDAAVHPTQVYETLAGALIFAFLWARRRRPAPDGAIVFQWFVLAGLAFLFGRPGAAEAPLPGRA